MWYKASMMPNSVQKRIAIATKGQLGLIVALLLLASFPLSTRARTHTYAIPLHNVPQDEPSRASIKSADGYVFVWNRQDIHFSILVKGKEVQPLNSGEQVFFNVDGMLLQIQLVSISEFAPGAKAEKLSDKGVLAAHRDWESKYIEGMLGAKLKVQSAETKLANGTETLLWEFDMPKALNADARKQLYLTVVSGDYVLLLNSAAMATVSEEKARQFLVDSLATLKISPTPIDVKKLSEQIRKGVGP